MDSTIHCGLTWLLSNVSVTLFSELFVALGFGTVKCIVSVYDQVNLGDFIETGRSISYTFKVQIQFWAVNRDASADNNPHTDLQYPRVSYWTSLGYYPNTCGHSWYQQQDSQWCKLTDMMNRMVVNNDWMNEGAEVVYQTGDWAWVPRSGFPELSRPHRTWIAD